MSSQLWWYTARASGIVAWLVVTAGIVWGLVLSTKALGKRPDRTGCSTSTGSSAPPQ
jgi:hypothetical protein